MSILATNKGGATRELIPAGNYVARCIRMVHVGTVTEIIMGKAKVLNKVRLTWELPTEKRVFDVEKGEQPLVIDNEYNLSLHEKSNLRAMLKSWRGKDFTEEQAQSFDISVLLGKPCFLNIVHVPGKKDPSQTYQQIAGVTSMPKGVECPKQINPTFILDYNENWSEEKYNTLPDFIKQKMAGSVEYAEKMNPETHNLKNVTDEDLNGDDGDGLPF